MSKIVIAIYNHPELYPPTLNAINNLSTKTDKISVICRNDFMEANFKYPKNVEITFTTKPYSVYEIDNIRFLLKLFYFIKFSFVLIKTIRKEKPKTLICYDHIPLFSYYLSRFLIPKQTRVWYHNHDTPPVSKNQNFLSVSYWASLYHNKGFLKTDIFSLPSKERKKYFPIGKYKGKTYIVPNYPSKLLFNKTQTIELIGNEPINLIYQGSLGPNHGFEELLPLLSNNKTNINLTLLGKIREQYKDQLIELAIKLNVADKFTILPMIPYSELPSVTCKYHVGLAVHKPYNITYSTGATASNKIFEYIASGLPVIFYDTPHYKNYYDSKGWAFFWDLESESFFEIIDKIKSNYKNISELAIQDYEQEFNFEYIFESVIKFSE